MRQTVYMVGIARIYSGDKETIEEHISSVFTPDRRDKIEYKELIRKLTKLAERDNVKYIAEINFTVITRKIEATHKTYQGIPSYAF